FFFTYTNKAVLNFRALALAKLSSPRDVEQREVSSQFFFKYFDFTCKNSNCYAMDSEDEDETLSNSCDLSRYIAAMKNGVGLLLGVVLLVLVLTAYYASGDNPYHNSASSPTKLNFVDPKGNQPKEP